MQGYDVRFAQPPQVLRLVLFAAVAAAIAWLSLLPDGAPPGIGVSDKLKHAAAYLVLTLSGLWAWPGRRWLVLAGVMAFGIGMELLQAGVTLDRQGDWRDAIANAVGALGGLALAHLGNEAALVAKRRSD